MALALTPTRGVYRKLDTVENCSWIGNCIQTALVRGLEEGGKKFRSKMRYYGLRRLTQQLQVPTYVCKRGTNKIRAEAEVQCPCLLTLAFGANLIQPTHSDRVYEKIHGTGTHVAHR